MAASAPADTIRRMSTICSLATSTVSLRRAGDAEEICVGGELSGPAKPGFFSHQVANGDEAYPVRQIQPAPVERVHPKSAQRIGVALHHMLQHLDQPIKVSTLSAMAGLSQSSFFVLFKAATGRTPLDFFIRARMRRAGELLEETTLQIKEIAARLGYDDQFYFSRLFKSVHGVSPREYRFQKGTSPARDLKLKPVSQSWSASCLPQVTPAGQSQAGGNGRALIGRFQPSAKRA